MIIELSFSIVALGAPLNDTNRNTSIKLLKWVKSQGFDPFHYLGKDIKNKLYDPEQIVDREIKWNEEDFKKHGKNLLGTNRSHLHVSPHFDTSWEQVRYFGVTINLFEDIRQYNVRFNIFLNMLVKKRTDYDELLRKFSSLALGLHKKIKPEVTFIERDKTRHGFSFYNLKTLPMWTGWYSIYGGSISKKYNLNEIKSPLSTIKIGKDKDNTIIETTKPWSEYYRYGWSTEEKGFLKSIGGKLLKGGK